VEPPLLPSVLAADRLLVPEEDFFASVRPAVDFALLALFAVPDPAVDLRAVVFFAVVLRVVVFLAVDFLAVVFFVVVVFFAVVFFAVDFLAVLLVALLRVEPPLLPSVFAADRLLAPEDDFFARVRPAVDFFAAPDLAVVFLAVVRFAVVFFAVDLVALEVRFAADFLAADFVAFAVVVLRVELVAARVTLGAGSSLSAGTRASCIQDVRPCGRRSSHEKIALRRDGCQHLGGSILRGRLCLSGTCGALRRRERDARCSLPTSSPAQRGGRMSPWASGQGAESLSGKGILLGPPDRSASGAGLPACSRAGA
jgi:hypothetical protein